MNGTLRRGAVLLAASVMLAACGSANTGGSGSTGGGSTGAGPASIGSGSTGGGSGGSTGGGSTGSTGGSSGSTGGGTTGNTGTGGGSAGNTGSGTGSGGTGSGGTGGGSTGGGSSDAKFNLIASPDNVSCNYIPNGALGGADLLNVDFYFLIIGGNPSDVPGGLAVTGTSNTGLATSYHTSPNNQAVSVAQFALRPGDFGALNAVTITVDSANQVNETDESDNTISVSVQLPSQRPTSVIDPLACTATQG